MDSADWSWTELLERLLSGQKPVAINVPVTFLLSPRLKIVAKVTTSGGLLRGETRSPVGRAELLAAALSAVATGQEAATCRKEAANWTDSMVRETLDSREDAIQLA